MIYKTRINYGIVFHRMTILFLTFLILWHFNENPSGLTIALVLLLSTILFYKTDYIELDDKELKIKSKYGIFAHTKVSKFDTDNIKSIIYKDLLAEGEWVFIDEIVIVFSIVFGNYFYQSENILTIIFLDDTEKYYKINVPDSELDVLIRRFRKMK